MKRRPRHLVWMAVVVAVAAHRLLASPLGSVLQGRNRNAHLRIEPPQFLALGQSQANRLQHVRSVWRRGSKQDSEVDVADENLLQRQGHGERGLAFTATGRRRPVPSVLQCPAEIGNHLELLRGERIELVRAER